MKKIIFFLCFTVIICFLSACDPGTYVIHQDELTDVVSIELIEYKNPSQEHFTSWVPNHFDDLKPFDIANATVIEKLQDSRKSEFITSFVETDILYTYYAYDSPVGVCIRLNYKNGNFLIIWANYNMNSFGGYIGEYSVDGSVLSFWGSFSALDYYQDLVNNFFEYNI